MTMKVLLTLWMQAFIIFMCLLGNTVAHSYSICAQKVSIINMHPSKSCQLHLSPRNLSLVLPQHFCVYSCEFIINIVFIFIIFIIISPTLLGEQDDSDDETSLKLNPTIFRSAARNVSTFKTISHQTPVKQYTRNGNC